MRLLSFAQRRSLGETIREIEGATDDINALPKRGVGKGMTLGVLFTAY